MNQPRLIAVLEVQREGGTDDCLITFSGEDGQPYSARIAAGALNALYAAVQTQIQARQASTALEVQLATLTGFRKAVHESGTPILELHLDGTPLAMAVPRSALPHLRNALSELETLTAPPSQKPNH